MSSTSITFNTSQGTSDLVYGGISYADSGNELTYVSTTIVTSITSSAFLNVTALTSITFGNQVATIGSSAFNGCTSLTSVSFNTLGSSYSLTSIGDSAFESTAITSINIPSTTLTIGNSSFEGTNITSLNIPASVTTIGNNAFNGCTSLTSLTFNGSTLTSIGSYAFEGTRVASLTIPDSVTTIGDYAFLIDPVLANVTNHTGNVPTTYGVNIFGPAYNNNTHNFYSDTTVNPLYWYVFNNYPLVILHPTSCFNEGTLILTNNGYVPIENIKVGDEVMTYSQSYENATYKKVTYLLNQPFVGSDMNFDNAMCKYKCDNFPDLLITGGHSIMVDELSDLMKEYVKDNEYYIYAEGGKYRMLAGLDDRCEKVVEGIFNVYHLILENNGDQDNWDWIYANGVVTETMSEKYYHIVTGSN